ncbi:unnamed protein product [Psylliodes chrysocephalus]|uniref:NADP-dependent oxidoreductase domain-containing protein n=1 Tax=Psylliodes chrysocephalus TaxID=3402493 RepID=A0A9P0CA36_9CUCU|nr:unnamed protein product [Psylliodes chrysocephala]
MEKQVEAGEIKYIGISNFNIRQIDRITKIARINCVCLQHEMVEYFRNNYMLLVTYAPLGSPDLLKFKDLMIVQIVLPNLLGNILVKITEKHKKTHTQILIRFLIEKDVCIIPKNANMNRLRENLLALTFKLDENDMVALALFDDGDKRSIVDLQKGYRGKSVQQEKAHEQKAHYCIPETNKEINTYHTLEEFKILRLRIRLSPHRHSIHVHSERPMVGFKFNNDELFNAEPSETDGKVIWKAMEKQVKGGIIKLV